MRISIITLTVTLAAASGFAQSASSFSGAAGEPNAARAIAAAAPEVRRAQPVARAAAAVPAQSASSGSGAVFRTGDTFELRMTGMPLEDANMYSLIFTIGGDGMVNIPLGGQIRAAGLTQSQLEKAIEKKLVDEKIFTNPTATINVPNQARFVTVGGNVRAPNRQPWSSDLTLLVAVAAAGGGNEWAGDKIDLIRGGQVQTFSLKKLNRNPSDDPKLLPGDRLDMR
jgi:protein involved in polysaccharide export with SLBB domain